MRKTLILAFCLTLAFAAQAQIIVNHECTKLDAIPQSAIEKAKATLHIAYGHTSHGSQLISGMNGLKAFKGDLYAWNEGGNDGALDIDDHFMKGDLGNPDRTTWAQRTREYLKNEANANVNVVIWSWCGQAGSASGQDIDTYLSLMTKLENDFPKIKFVYMTGHLNGSGLKGNLHQRNQQIRDYCKANGKILYDFEDIESYDPDGTYYGDKFPNDNCDYDPDGAKPIDRSKNWAVDWQNAHTKGEDWYSCSAAHSKALNGNQKAYAAWHLWARLAGWDGKPEETTSK